MQKNMSKLNNGYIYVRINNIHNNSNVCKLGRTINLGQRDHTYATGEYIRGEFIIVIEILQQSHYNDKYVENLLQNNFKYYHTKKNGGNEFYDIKIIDSIIPFLQTTNIKFNILPKDDILN